MQARCDVLEDASFLVSSQSQSSSTSKYSSLKPTNTMPIKKNQDVAEKGGGKKDQAMNQKEDKPSKESSAIGKNEKKQAQKPG
jgi:hypothetical protein